MDTARLCARLEVREPEDGREVPSRGIHCGGLKGEERNKFQGETLLHVWMWLSNVDMEFGRENEASSGETLLRVWMWLDIMGNERQKQGFSSLICNQTSFPEPLR